MHLPLVTALALCICCCCQELPAVDQYLMGDAFKQYWYDQGAEMTSYQVQQQRYGEERAAEAIFIFVTEPFHQQQQVKSDNPNDAEAIPVLKLNRLRSFQTGIYPYRIMQSVFQPISKTQHNPALKINTSVQEWCGHVFEQWNYRANTWNFRLMSYFQSEGEQHQTYQATLLEDELWTRIRINPNNIPSGQQNIIPSALYRRFKHIPTKIEQAHISMTQGEQDTNTLSITYTSIKRSLHIEFSKTFPYSIESWREDYPGGGSSGKKHKRIFGPYWEWNSNNDQAKQKPLQLPLKSQP